MTEPSDKLKQSLIPQFQFDGETRAQLIDMCPPSRAWIEQYDVLVRAMNSTDAAVIASLEASGSRFLRGGIRPSSKVNQKTVLQQIEMHSRALRDILSSPEIEGTLADPLRMLAEASHKGGNPLDRNDYWQSYYKMLLSVELFAKHRLTRDVQPEAEEEAIEKIKRRKEYPRFVLLADLLATHQRITGLTPAAYATTDRLGKRRRSEAVEFLATAAPPILKAARVKNTLLDDQVLKIEIGRIKSQWEAGRRPELAYMFPDWGTRVHQDTGDDG